MLPLVFLGLALVCALVSRVLLLMAAVRISIWWALGVVLPFGPLAFRLKFPEEARRSMAFRLATVPCFGAYILMGPGATLSDGKSQRVESESPSVARLVHYGIEQRPAPTAAKIPSAPTPSLDARRAMNATEFERLHEWNAALRLRKRDLLHSDIAGNRDYVVDLALYNDAFARANAEKAALGQ